MTIYFILKDGHGSHRMIFLYCHLRLTFLILSKMSHYLMSFLDIWNEKITFCLPHNSVHIISLIFSINIIVSLLYSNDLYKGVIESSPIHTLLM